MSCPGSSHLYQGLKCSIVVFFFVRVCNCSGEIVIFQCRIHRLYNLIC